MREGPRFWQLAAVLLALAGRCWGKGLVLPLARRDGGLFARGLLRNATIPLHGAVKDYGYFYATLHLGTPAKQFAVIVDTGSTITYVPCAACGRNCGPHHKDEAFDPDASSTAVRVTCSSSKCVCGRPPCGCTESQECTYQRTYAEQSSSAGVMIEDRMHLGDGPVDIVFGCEMKETGMIYSQEADGILGLGNSEVSLINQLAGRAEIEDVFALCFGSVEGDGALMLGDVPLGSQFNVALEYTPLLTSQQHPHYYCVSLLALRVGAKKLDVPQERYDAGYGTVLDSGTTFTYLPSEAFVQFRNAVTLFALEHGLHSVKGPDPMFGDICFGGAPTANHPEALEKVFPPLELQFAGGITLRTSPLNYLFMHTVEQGAYCLGVFDNSGSGTLLGGITFRNILVQYDRRNRRVGFGPAPCQQIGQHFVPCDEELSSHGSSVPPGPKCSQPPPHSLQASSAAAYGAVAPAAAPSAAQQRRFFVVLGLVLSAAAAGFAAAAVCRGRAAKAPRRPSAASVMALKGQKGAAPPRASARGFEAAPTDEEGADQQLISLERGQRLAQALAEAYDARHAREATQLPHRALEVTPLEESPPSSHHSSLVAPTTAALRPGSLRFDSSGGETSAGRGLAEAPASPPSRLPPAELVLAVEYSLSAAERAEETDQRLAAQHLAASQQRPTRG